MEDLGKYIKIIKVIFCSISVLVVIVGLSFSYLIAQLDDAPGVVLIGTTITLVGASLVYGLGEIIIQLKKNNNLLKEIIDRNK